MGALRVRLAKRLAEWRSQGRDVLGEGAPGDLAATIVDAWLPSPSDWNDVGPLLSEASASARAGTDVNGLLDSVAARQVLALTTSDGLTIYPEWQFDSDVFSGLVETAWSLHADAWTVAAWFTHQSDELGGESPVTAVRVGRIEDVRREAHDLRRRLDQ